MTGAFAACFRTPFVLWVALATAACIGIPSRAASNPDVVTALNAVRANGCGGRSGVALPLRENAQLTEAAKRVAGRLPYQDALAAAGYRATRSSMIRISGDSGAKSVANIVASKYCAVLVESAYREIGIHQQMRATWIIVAAPFSPPAPEASGAVAERVLQRVNQARSQERMCGNTRFAAARSLRLNATLSRASLAHAVDMAQHSTLSHEGRDGRSPADRVTRAGYRWRSVGENIASGPTTPEAVVDGWIRSPPHCANLMAPHFTEMGIAYSVNRASEAGIYWVQVFGTPR